MPAPEAPESGGPRPAPRWLGTAVALAVSAAFWLGTLREGHLLVRDFVTVPDPVLGASALGQDGAAPRALVMDFSMALLHPIVSSAVQQRVLLIGSVVLLGAGVAALVRSRGWAAVVVAAVVATWNPYVVERLLLGQAPTLLGVAVIPWLVLAARIASPPRQVFAVMVAALPAMLTPFGSVLAVIVVSVVGARSCGPRRGALLAGVGVMWCLPWVLPALRAGTTVGAPSGAAAFAVRDDSAGGLLASVVSWGGIWAPGAHLASRDSLITMFASAVLVVAIGGAAAIAVRQHEAGALTLAILWLAPIALALVLSSGPGLILFERLQEVPGVALIRDTHRLLGVSVIAGAVLLGGLASRAARAAPGVIVAAGLVSAVSLSLLTVPDGPRRLWEAYTPVDFPVEWSAAVDSVPDDARGVLVLPWQPIRPPVWGGHVPFLDPVPRALYAPTAVARDLTVRRDGAVITVPEGENVPPLVEDASSARRVLDDLGVDAVWWWGAPGARLPSGFEVAHEGSEFTIWRRSS